MVDEIPLEDTDELSFVWVAIIMLFILLGISLCEWHSYHEKTKPVQVTIQLGQE